MRVIPEERARDELRRLVKDYRRPWPDGEPPVSRDDMAEVIELMFRAMGWDIDAH